MIPATANEEPSGIAVLMRLWGTVIAAGIAVAFIIFGGQALLGVPEYVGHGSAMILVLPLVASIVWSPAAMIYAVQRVLRGENVPRLDSVLLAINAGGLLLWWGLAP